MKRVLMVDSDPLFSQRLIGLIDQSDEALTVSVEDSIAGATKSLRADPFDLIISELCLPLIPGQAPSLEDGVQFALLVKRRYPELPLCLLGDLQAPELHAHHQRLFGAECHQKPQGQEPLEALALTIRRRLFGEVTGLRPELALEELSELVLLDNDGEVLAAQGSEDPELRSDLVAFLSMKSLQMAQALGTSACARIESFGARGRFVVTLSEQRQFFGLRGGATAAISARSSVELLPFREALQADSVA